jgi:CPA2 family monovalent cation:H+ antiporter-2
VLFNYIVPLLFGVREAARNRELPILLAIVTAAGTAWAAHWAGLSPAIGAFIAGILLAGSPYATQVRADVAPLRTVFVTMFFSSIGMLADPAWAMEHWAILALTVVAVVLGKAIVTSGVILLFRSLPGQAVAAGICLAQVGEFSVVLADAAHHSHLIDDHLFKLMVSTTIATLFLTPYLVAIAPRAARVIGRMTASGSFELTAGDEASRTAAPDGSIVIVGFGPAGQRVAEGLIGEHKSQLVVVELNPRSAAIGRSYNLRTYIGDATRPEVLEHLHIESAKVVAITVPDPTVARQVIEQVRVLAPDAQIVVRARYHVQRWQLALAGAQIVVDEEDQVGMRIADQVHATLKKVPGT